MPRFGLTLICLSEPGLLFGRRTGLFFNLIFIFCAPARIFAANFESVWH